MFKKIMIIIGFALSTLNAQAEVGLNAGVGIPFLTQAGLTYRMNSSITVAATYNLLDLSVGTSTAKLSMPEVMVQLHPFQGAFFIGAGVGQEDLEVTATDAVSGNQAAIEVSAMTALAKLGWMWGVSNGGFWFGMDIAYVMPMSPERTITAPGVSTSSQSYRDAVDAADQFGKTSFINITFLKIGYLF